MNGDEDQEKIEKAAAAVFSADDMERTEEYLKRGQPFQHLTIEELGQRWTNGIKAWCRDYSKEWLREFDDAAAELRLRGADPPFETVRDEIAALLAECRRDILEHPDEARDSIEARIDELLSKRGQSSH
jgi:hypothetical protein